MATWPVSLPQVPLRSGYSEKPAKNSIRSKMEVGPAKSRRRISAGVRDHKVQFIFSPTQLVDFETFFDETLLSGSLSYEWVHPRLKVINNWRITNVPEIVPIDKKGYYLVTLTVEQLP